MPTSEEVKELLTRAAAAQEKSKEIFSSWCWCMQRISLGIALACAYRAFMCHTDSTLAAPALLGGAAAHQFALKSNVAGIAASIAAAYWAYSPWPGLDRRLALVVLLGGYEILLYVRLVAAASLTKGSVVRLHAFPLPVVFVGLCCVGTVLMSKMRREADGVLARVEQAAKMLRSTQQSSGAPAKR